MTEQKKKLLKAKIAAENQRFEILKYADEKHLTINRRIEETVSSTRKLCALYSAFRAGMLWI